ncbi:MAG: hypothetical protein GC154_09030 [bacterium]|nr:hypothetical protein [bacterium]
MFIYAAAAAIAGAGWYAWFIEPNRFVLRRIPLEMNGPFQRTLRVLHLSDFHFFEGRTARRDYLWKLAEEPADLVFITGDMIDDDSGIELCVEALKPFQPALGVYAVLGNHDYVLFRSDDFIPRGELRDRMVRFNDSERLIASLRDIGVNVLINQSVTLEVDGAPLSVAGVDDPYLERDDIEAAFAGLDPESVILTLAHAPERYRELARAGASMVFSGHTHGGQICLPFYGPIVTRTRAPRSYAYGLTALNGTLFYTSGGLGSSRITRPRLFRPPEAVLFELSFKNRAGEPGPNDGLPVAAPFT